MVDEELWNVSIAIVAYRCYFQDVYALMLSKPTLVCQAEGSARQGSPKVSTCSKYSTLLSRVVSTLPSLRAAFWYHSSISLQPLDYIFIWTVGRMFVS